MQATATGTQTLYTAAAKLGHSGNKLRQAPASPPSSRTSNAAKLRHALAGFPSSRSARTAELRRAPTSPGGLRRPAMRSGGRSRCAPAGLGKLGASSSNLCAALACPGNLLQMPTLPEPSTLPSFGRAPASSHNLRPAPARSVDLRHSGKLGEALVSFGEPAGEGILPTWWLSSSPRPADKTKSIRSSGPLREPLAILAEVRDLLG